MADIAELIVALKLRDGVSAGLGRLNGQLKGMQGGLSQVGKGVGQVGSGLSSIATRGAIAAAGGLTAVITTASSMEEAFTGVEKTVDASSERLEELRGNLRKMAGETGTAFETLAAIGESGGALGVPTEQLEEFIDVINRLGVSTDLSTDEAATSIGQLRTILHLGDGEIRSFADTLVALGNAGASTEPQIVGLAARFAAAGNRAGLSSDEILALSSAVTSMGVEVEAGGTALSQTFNEIAVAIGKGGKEVEGFTDVLGISSAEFEKRWRTDALGTFQDFLRELDKLDPIAQSVALDMAGITGARQLSAIGLMADNWEFVGDQLDITKDKTGALNRESDKFYGTSAAGFRKLRENLRNTADTIGSELLPITNELITEFTTWLQTPDVQAGIKAFAKDLSQGIRDLVKEIKNTDFGPLIETMKGAAAIAKAGFDAFNALPGPVKQLALAAIVANKASGGAVGSIAKGLGNILAGVIKIGFGRGESPLRPMFVQQVGGTGFGGLPGGGRGGAGRSTNPFGGPGSTGIGSKALRLIPIVGTAVALAEMGGIDVSGFVDDIFGRDGPARRVRTGALTKDDQRPTQPTADDGSFDRFGEKLDKLATNEVIQHLERTNEIGQKGIGSSFQFGIADGLDPIGDVATRILARAEDPKAPQVLFEVQQHLAGLEEIQAQYLAQGDIKLANKVQTNIDTLHELIGTTDTVRGVTAALAAQAASSDVAMLATARTQTERLRENVAAASRVQAAVDAGRAATDRGFGATTGRLDTVSSRVSGVQGEIARKNLSPVVKVFNNISATLLQQRIVQGRAITGTGFTEF